MDKGGENYQPMSTTFLLLLHTMDNYLFKTATMIPSLFNQNMTLLGKMPDIISMHTRNCNIPII